MDKIQSIEKLFFLIVTYSYLILPVLFLIFFRKTRNPIVIALYGIVFFILLVLSNSIPNNSFQLQKLFSNLYTLLEYLFFSILILVEIKNIKTKKLILFLSVGFVVFQTIYFLTYHQPKLDAVPIGVETILLFIFIFLFFYQFIKSSEPEFVYNHPCFWISVGILIYLGGTFFFNILANHISSEQIDKYWFLTYIADIIKNLLFALALFMYKRQPIINFKTEKIPDLDFNLHNQ